MLSPEENDRFKTWHQRLGRLNMNVVRKLIDEDMVYGMNISKREMENVHKCKVCDLSKITQLPFQDSNNIDKDVLGTNHTDICGPMSTPSLGGARYFATFIDDCSTYTEIVTLKENSEIFSVFKTYNSPVEKQTGKLIKKIRSDNPKEYLSKQFTEYLKEEGITRQLSTDYMPQQNGVAERANRIIVEMARTMLTESKLPLTL